MSLDQSVSKASVSEPRQDESLDKKNALIERLNNVVRGLSKDSITSLSDRTIQTINSEVDVIESLLGNDETNAAHDEDENDFNDPETFINMGNDASRSPSTPDKEPWQSSAPVSPVASPKIRSEPDITVPQALKIANAAEQLASQLTASIQELQKRREESDHIHSLLISRLEKAAERIVYLESEFSEMDDDFEASQSELRFLRIQMQAIEARYSQHVPQEDDEELSQSIVNWKDDWEDIDRRSKARRMKRCELLANVHASLA